MTNAVTRAAVPLSFVGETEVYLLRALTLQDIEDLNEWVRHIYVNTRYNLLPDNLPSDEKTKFAREAMEVAQSWTWMDGPGKKIMATPPGAIRLLWQSIQTDHPTVSVQDLSVKLANTATLVENLQLIQLAFVQANALPEGLLLKKKIRTNRKQAEMKKRKKKKKRRR